MALVKFNAGVYGNWRHRIARVILDADHLNGGYVAAGWDRNEKYPDGTSVARVALFNEFGVHNADGSVHSPARPFMRPAYQKNKGAIMALQITVIGEVLAGKITPEKALNKLGYQMWSFIRAAILSNPPPPNAPRTVAKKRRAGRPAVTLIDTRRMLDTLSYKIYIGGKGRPPMKEDPVAPGSSGGGGGSTGVTVKPQHAPGGGGTGFSPMTPGEVKGIPKVMSPDERKREKKRLRDALKKPRKKKSAGAKDPSPAGPGGGKRVVVRVGGGKKVPQPGPKPSGPGAPKGPKAPRAPKAPGSPKAPRAPKTPGSTGPRPKAAPKAPGSTPRRPRTGGTPKKPRATTPHVVRPPRKTERDKKRDERDKVRKERNTRSKTAHTRRGKGVFDSLEEALLRHIISLARAASRYGRSL